MKNKKWILAGILLLLVFCITWSKSSDFSQDLGRHLKLGEIIVKTGHIPGTNLFSYTYPGFSFTNHHWLSEAVYYILTSVFGLQSLFILRFILVAGAVIFALKSSSRASHYLVTAISALLFVPLLTGRIDIRPEEFGYFFFSLLLFMVFFQKGRRSNLLIPLIMALWVNMHISFVFGLFLLCIGLVRDRKRKESILLYVLGILATLINPHGLAGAVEPFVIFRNYGYTISENQNLFFMNSVVHDPVQRIYLYLIPLVICFAVILLVKHKYLQALVLTVFFTLGVWQVRHIPFFIFAAIPFISQSVEYLIADLKSVNVFHRFKRVPLAEIVIAMFLIVIYFVVSNTFYTAYDYRRVFGYGYYESEKEATDFVLAHHLQGNIFNNFDIGGYLIYRLYPEYRVFVDNRPEAYPANFFRDVYIPMQENPQLRTSLFRRYNIHTVIFSHTDSTPWGKTFMAQIFSDPRWKMLFVNDTTVVLSDESDMVDVRSRGTYLEELAKNYNDPTSLLYLYSFFIDLRYSNLAAAALDKFRHINPVSCTLKRYEYEFAGEGMPGGVADSRPWWCY